MKDIKWFINRIKAMSLFELFWRVQQKSLQRKEFRHFYKSHVTVANVELPSYLSELQIEVDRLSVNWNNKFHSVFVEQELLGGYKYDEYKMKWSAGFQTEEYWPEQEFSYKIPIIQRMDIGDIRTNWELNRHFQFASLAKSFYLTGEEKYYEELKELFEDWNEHNLFLHGIQWTSAMEIAIRINSWVYMYAFLSKAYERYDRGEKKILTDIKNGILVMTQYIVKHRARYSSANNHLIVEMYAVALVGILCNYQPWINIALKILSNELHKQNYCDGVNKEMSLHYQSFIMEAYSLLIILLKKNNIQVSEEWYRYLERLSEFLADSCGEHGEVIVFGDNDEGKILDLQGRIADYYRYILTLSSCILQKKYTKMETIHENIYWLVDDIDINRCREKSRYISEKIRCYRKGGYTFWRSKNDGILLCIDHAPLGFGALAAHGHADALSFQMYVEGVPFLVDSGTYNYHSSAEKRDFFRSTRAHNTIEIEGENQSQMLGPFIWGKRAKTNLIDLQQCEECIFLEAKTSYSGVFHKRKFEIKDNCVVLNDTISAGKGKMYLLLGPNVDIFECTNREYKLRVATRTVIIKTSCESEINMQEYSSKYGYKQMINCISCTVNDNVTRTEIIFL